jgi:uncharacterized membrane protein
MGPAAANMLDTKPMDDYLGQIDQILQGRKLSNASRIDILSELKSHLIDRAKELDSMDGAIRAMGDAQEIAAQFALLGQTKAASQSHSPATLLNAAWNLATLGARGFLLFLSGVIGYTFALAGLFVAVLKVLEPSEVGFWIGDGQLVWGIPATTEGLTELAGNWFIPISLWMAFVFGFGTTMYLRRRLRRAASQHHESATARSSAP